MEQINNLTELLDSLHNKREPTHHRSMGWAEWLVNKAEGFHRLNLQETRLFSLFLCDLLAKTVRSDLTPVAKQDLERVLHFFTERLNTNVTDAQPQSTHTQITSHAPGRSGWLYYGEPDVSALEDYAQTLEDRIVKLEQYIGVDLPAILNRADEAAKIVIAEANKREKNRKAVEEMAALFGGMGAIKI